MIFFSRFLCQSLIEPTVPLNLSWATTLNSISTGCDPYQSFLCDLVISSLGCFGILSILPREQRCGSQIQRERGEYQLPLIRIVFAKFNLKGYEFDYILFLLPAYFPRSINQKESAVNRALDGSTYPG